MPTYDYRCQNCGHEWELDQRISENPAKKCPKCGKLKAQRQISGGSFILKGGGWYADLYHKPAGGDAKPEAAKADSPKADAPKADAPKTEAKPAKSEKPAKKASSAD